MKSREQLYRHRLKRLEYLQEVQNRLYNRVSVYRGTVFLFGVISFFGLRRVDYPVAACLAIALSLLVFFILVTVHDRVSLYRDKIKSFVDINKESLKRLSDEWGEFETDGLKYCSAESPFLRDLDIFGRNSLFQMIQQTATKKGRDTLAGLLSLPADFGFLKSRQEGVRELSRRIAFRHRLLLEGRSVPSLTGAEKLLEWSRTPAFLLNKRWLLLLRRLLLLSSSLLFFYYLISGNFPLLLFSLAAQMLLFVSTAKKCQEQYKPALFAESSFLAYSGMFRSIERMRFKSGFLLEAQSKIKTGESPLSDKMDELEKINHQLSVCFSLVYPFLNTLFLWDLYYLYRQEVWKEEMKPSLELCFDVLGTFEALSSLAGFAFDNPEYTYPLIDEKRAPFHALSLGHPLIPGKERVCNDISVDSSGTVMLITGSNMSGKSTFIRTVGINMVLAFSGAPVAAASLHARPCEIVTCIQVSDSLKLHLSHFYAEVREIKRVLDSVFPARPSGKDLPVLYLIDEIFSGTNTKERLLASRGIILKLALSRSYGFLTTHDLDLTALESECPEVENHHFQDGVTDAGEMVFDYKIKAGPVTSTNALKVIELAGIRLV